MEKNMSKSYIAMLTIWAISSLAAMFISFYSINYTNTDIMGIVKFITCLLAGTSSILSIFVVMNKFNKIKNILLIIFPVVLFTCIFFFSRKTDYLLYDIYFVITVIFLIIELILYWVKKDEKELANAIFPILYSGALMIIKTIELDRYVTILDDDLISYFIYIGLVAGVISIIIYIFLVKNRNSKKEYVGNLLLTFFGVFVLFFGVPYCMMKNINYSLDVSTGTVCEYEIIDKEYSVGGRRSAGNYYVVILYNDEEIKVKLPSSEYDKYSINDYIVLTEYSGVFNITYLEYKIDN